MTMMQADTVRPNGNMPLTRAEKIERKLDTEVVGTIGISPLRGMAVESMSQAIEIAKLMSLSGSAVPAHLRDNPGACLAIAIQGWEWSMNPFALANKSYVVNDRLGYEAQLFAAIITRRAPIKGRIKSEYTGSGDSRQCKVWAILTDGERVEYMSPLFGKILPKNSPLWRNDPDQQLHYFSVRAFSRRHFPDVMMGVYTSDELQDNPPIDVTPTAASTSEPRLSRTKSLLAKVTSRPVSENQTFEPDPAAAQAQETNEPQTAEGQPSPAVQPGNAPEPRTAEPAKVDKPGGQGAEAPEIDVSGADTEPPNEAEAAQIAADELRQALEQPWTEVEKVLADAGVQGGMTKHAAIAAVKAHVRLVLGKAGKEASIPLPSRLGLFEAMRAGKVGADGKIQA